MTEPSSESPIRLSIVSSPSQLAVVRGAVEGLCRAVGFNEPCVTHVVLSVDEALSNVIRHAYDGAAEQPIEIELSALSAGEGVRIRIRDRGRRVESESFRANPPTRGRLRPGGLGMKIMTECMDRLDYVPAEGGGTILTMVKHLDKGSRRT